MARVPTWDRAWDVQPYMGSSDGALLITSLNPGETLQRTTVTWHFYFPSSDFVQQDYYTNFQVAVAITYATESLPPPFPVNPIILPLTDDYLWWDHSVPVHNGLTSSTFYTIPWDPPGRIDTSVQRGPVQYGAAVWFVWANPNVQHFQGWAVSSNALVLREPAPLSPAWTLPKHVSFASLGEPSQDTEVT